MKESRYLTENLAVSLPIDIANPPYLTLESTYSEMWLTNKDRNPLGHFAILPRFDQDHFPFVTCTSSKGIMLINLKDNYAETLIDATSSCAWG